MKQKTPGIATQCRVFFISRSPAAGTSLAAQLRNSLCRQGRTYLADSGGHNAKRGGPQAKLTHLTHQRQVMIHFLHLRPAKGAGSFTRPLCGRYGCRKPPPNLPPVHAQREYRCPEGNIVFANGKNIVIPAAAMNKRGAFIGQRLSTTQSGLWELPAPFAGHRWAKALSSAAARQSELRLGPPRFALWPPESAR